jgi:hypothetical protein
MWPATDTEAINPPLMRRAPGRPKKKRNRSNDEPKDSRVLPRHLSTVQCKKCLKFGHNIRSCKGKTAADREIPKGGNKQKKTNAGTSDVAPTGAKKQKKTNAGTSDVAPTGAKKQKKTTKAKQTKTSETEPSMQTESSVQVAVVVTQSSQAPQTQGSQADV